MIETATSTLSILPSNKEQVDQFSQMLIDELNGGYTNPLDILNMVKCMTKVFENVKPTLDQLSLAEAEKFEGKEFKYKGMKISLKELGTKYDYSQSNDPFYQRYQESLSQAKAKMSERETFLKTLKEPMNIIDDGGEPFTIYPPVKSSTTGLTVSLL